MAESPAPRSLFAQCLMMLALMAANGQVFCRTLYEHLPESKRTVMTKLAHVNIRTTDLEHSVAFYRDVLGLTAGPAATRPQSADHVWMSDDQGNPCIHLQRTSAAREVGDDRAGVHHLALACADVAQWRLKLGAMGIDFQETEFPAARILQFNLHDPDGVRLELLFAAE